MRRGSKLRNHFMPGAPPNLPIFVAPARQGMPLDKSEGLVKGRLPLGDAKASLCLPNFNDEDTLKSTAPLLESPIMTGAFALIQSTLL
jgi:hypothetical protein